MSAATFVATSVLVANQDPRHASIRRQAANRLDVEQASGLPTVSTNVLAELYLALTRKRPGGSGVMTSEEAAQRVEAAAGLNVVAVQKEHVLDALRLRTPPSSASGMPSTSRARRPRAAASS